MSSLSTKICHYPTPPSSAANDCIRFSEKYPINPGETPPLSKQQAEWIGKKHSFAKSEFTDMFNSKNLSIQYQKLGHWMDGNGAVPKNAPDKETLFAFNEGRARAVKTQGRALTNKKALLTAITYVGTAPIASGLLATASKDALAKHWPAGLVASALAAVPSLTSEIRAQPEHITDVDLLFKKIGVDAEKLNPKLDGLLAKTLGTAAQQKNPSQSTNSSEPEDTSTALRQYADHLNVQLFASDQGIRKLSTEQYAEIGRELAWTTRMLMKLDQSQHTRAFTLIKEGAPSGD